ncbi:MAG: LytTR family DNA-binding domain-containing protein [Eubacteriales bacterium]|nr:LytTR family DNA-binding domain-containing protein [Eubacteriales bacterium]
MYISICDDDEKERKILAEYVYKAVKKYQLFYRVVTFGSGEQLLDFIEKGKTCPINFLDIYMQGINGVELADKILKKDRNAAVVFTTVSPDFMAEGFQLGAVHYLLKPLIYQNVEIALNRCLRYTGKAERYIELSVDREIRKILFSKIIYVEFQNRYCLIHTEDGVLKSYLRLGDLEEKLKDLRFLRCHRSFLVNLDYVSSISGYNFILADGSSVPVRREERAAMKLKFENYYFEKSRQDF